MKKHVIHPTKTTTGTRADIEICESKHAEQWSIYRLDEENHEHWIADFATYELAKEYIELKDKS